MQRRHQAGLGDPVGGDLARKGGALGVIDQHRVAPLEVELDAGPEHGGLGLADFGDALLELQTHLGFERPHGEFQLGALGDHAGS